MNNKIHKFLMLDKIFHLLTHHNSIFFLIYQIREFQILANYAKFTKN